MEPEDQVGREDHTGVEDVTRAWDAVRSYFTTYEVLDIHGVYRDCRLGRLETGPDGEGLSALLKDHGRKKDRVQD